MFSSEAEAFAAAEQTYRSYVDALNSVVLSDPETFEAVYAWTAGDTRAEAKRSLSQMSADNWSVSGTSVVEIAQPVGLYTPESTEVELTICLDVSTVRLTDEGGSTKVDDNRPDVQSMKATLSAAEASATGWLITSVTGRESEPLCR